MTQHATRQLTSPLERALDGLDGALPDALGGDDVVRIVGAVGHALRARRPRLAPHAPLDALFDATTWRIRAASFDLARAGRSRLFLFRPDDVLLGLEHALAALVERCAVLYRVEEEEGSSAAPGLLHELRDLLVDAGLPPSQLRLMSFALGDPTVRAVLARRGHTLVVDGDPACVAEATGVHGGSLPRSRQLHPSVPQSRQLHWVSETVRHASAIDFYRERLERAGVLGGRITGWDQFHAIPLTEREDLHRHGPPREDTLLRAPFRALTDAYLFGTGGTTGALKFAVYGHDEWDEVTDIAAQQLVQSGIAPGDRVGNVFSPGRLWSAFLAIDAALRKIGCVVLPFGEMDPPEVLARSEDFGVTALVGTPSVLARLGRAAEEHPSPPTVERLIFAGEHMPAVMIDYLERTLGARAIRSVAYSAIDAGVIGFQPADGPLGVYHALDNHAFVEILDTAGRPVAMGEEGDVVVTNHARRLFPVLRLRTGDVARRLEGGRFELRGREDDKLRVGGGNLYLSDVEELCRRFSEALAPLFQVRLSKAGADDRYELALETKRVLDEAARAALSARVKEAYLGIAPHLGQIVRGGLLRHFEVTLLPPGALPQNARTGKTRRVVDRRLDAELARPAALDVAGAAHVEQSALYATTAGARGWRAVVSNEAYRAATERLELGSVAACVAKHAQATGVELVGLGCGDGAKEVRLAAALRDAGVPVGALRLLDVSAELVDEARAHAEERLAGAGVLVDATRGDLHELQTHLGAWDEDGAAARWWPRLYAMFGGTFSNLDDEVAFARRLFALASPGDLLLLDVSEAYAPADRPDEVRRLDPRLSSLGESGLRPPEEAWLRGALPEAAQSRLDAASARIRARFTTACCTVPGSYAVEFIATREAGEGAEISVMRIKRYAPEGLAEALRTSGWTVEAVERGIACGLVVVLRKG